MSNSESQWSKYKAQFGELLEAEKDSGAIMLINASHSENGSLLTIFAPNKAAKIRISGYATKISEFMQQHTKDPDYKVIFALEDKRSVFVENNTTTDSPQSDKSSVSNLVKQKINPAFQFDRFIKGKSNSLAYRTCVEIAERLTNPEKANNNIILIYGEVGLGKSHLANSIVNYAKKHNKSNKCLLLNHSDFRNAYVRMAERKEILQFKEILESGKEIIIFDDIDLIKSKTIATYFEFIFELLDSFQNNNNNIIFITKQDPSKHFFGMEQDSLSDSLRSFKSRINEGVKCKISEPDFALRLEYLEETAQAKKFTLTREQASRIANENVTDFRKLNGLLNEIKNKLDNAPQATDEIIKQAIPSVLGHSKNYEPSNIIDIVGGYLKVSSEEMLGTSRRKNIANARHIAIYLIRKLTGRTLQNISTIFNYKEHSTVSYSIGKIEDAISNNSEIGKNVDSILKIITHN